MYISSIQFCGYLLNFGCKSVSDENKASTKKQIKHKNNANTQKQNTKQTKQE